jgi:polysaccharide pyruvyl transferase WcaK-like protein
MNNGVARCRSPRSEAPSPASDRFFEPIPPSAPTDPPGPRVVLLNDCRDQVNFGANALVDGLLVILRQSLPDATIFPIPSHWMIDPAFLGSFVDSGRGLQQPRAVFPSVADQFEAVADAWMHRTADRGANEYVTRLEGADLVVLNGEGSMYRTNPSAIRELFLAWFAKERLGIPTVFVNGTVHLTDVIPVLPAMVRKTFPILDAIAVREPCSIRNLQGYAAHVQAELVPDSAFVFTAADAPESPSVHAIKDQIGGAPYFCFDPGAMPIDHAAPNRSALYQLISRLVRLVPQAVFVANGPGDRFIQRVASETGSLYIETFTDYRDFMSLVADARFLVSGRYHNTIMAAIMGCPTIALASTSHKVHGACEMLDGVVGSPYDGTYLRPQFDAIEQRARAYIADRDDVSLRLLDVCRRRRSEAFRTGQLAADASQRQSLVRQGPLANG